MKKLYEDILAVVREAGEIVLHAEKNEMHTQEKSSRHDVVTAYDARVQRFLQTRLLALLPEAGFLGEEEGGEQAGESGWLFVVDPIDGTMNFLRGRSRSCVSVGLARDDEMQFGAVYDPYHDELFCAARGEGAFLNGKRIRVSDYDLPHALAYVGPSPYYPDCLPLTFALARRLTEDCSDIRRSGSAALELCDVACGRADLYYECRLSPWDYAAGSLIVTEAGGHVSTMEATPLRFREKCSLAAANGLCYVPLMERIEAARGQTSQK